MRCKTLLIWLRFGRKKTYPWRTLAMTACDYFYSSGVKKEQTKVSFLATLWKLDTPKIIELMNDLLW
jgi:hypothetical protein